MCETLLIANYCGEIRYENSYKKRRNLLVYCKWIIELLIRGISLIVAEMFYVILTNVEFLAFHNVLKYIYLYIFKIYFIGPGGQLRS